MMKIHSGDYSADCFISKLDSNLSSLLASTFFGGSNSEGCTAIVLDSNGNVYVTGETRSPDFPTTLGVYGEIHSGGDDGEIFISKFDGSLATLLASTLIPVRDGGWNEQAYSIALDINENVYIIGSTFTNNYPTTPDAYDRSYDGDSDIVLSKFSSNLSTLLASTFIGGTNYDYQGIPDLAFDESGNVFVTGSTLSLDFPTTPGAYDEIHSGGDYSADCFISKLDSNLSSLLASTFIGGSNSEQCYAIVLEGSGDVYVTGGT